MTSVRSVHIRQDVLEAIGRHAAREAPDECCGLLAGSDDRIDEAIETRNVLASASRYRIDPAAHIAANRRMRGSGRAVVGAYHSHPRTAAVPSERDVAEAQYPEFLWLIVSLQTGDPVYRAFRIDRGTVEEVYLVVEGDNQRPTPNSHA